MGRRTTCNSHLRQIALAFSQYTQDYSGRFPGESYNNGVDQGWTTVIQPHLKSVALYQCPSEANAQITDISLGRNDYSDYYYNTNLTYTINGAGIQTRGLSQSRLKAPTETILIGEGHNGRFDYTSLKTEDSRGQVYDAASESYSMATSGEEPRRRHAGGGMYAFADGHVKWLKPEAVSSGCNTGWTADVPEWCDPGVAARPGTLSGVSATFAAY